MTPEQIELVQRSFAKVVPIAAKAAQIFYGRLFEIAPELKPMFKSNMDDQGRMLMSMLASVVAGLNDLATILPTAESLALRHRDYGVVPEQYETVGEALLWTLEQGIGEDFTTDVRDAWVEAYGALSGAMINAAANAALPVAAE
ncbi:MAG: globin family protein [Alphaproteobacteria bacterium]|nr:globin family protein [Alphaproteobacteria bacterium]